MSGISGEMAESAVSLLCPVAYGYFTFNLGKSVTALLRLLLFLFSLNDIELYF